MEELWDLYNENRNKTGLTQKRGEPIPAGNYHLVVSAWIINDQGHYLMSQRQSNKPYPLCWECTGGSVLSGESSLQGALREVYEELGLNLATTQAKLIYQTRREQTQDFYDVWLFHANPSMHSFTLQKDEVADAQWMDKEKIYTLQRECKLHPLIDYLEKIL